MIEVEMESDVSCPRCGKLEPLLRRICDELNIPFKVKYLSTRAVASHEDSVLTHVMSKEWIERHGLPEHKQSLKKIAPVLDLLQKTGSQFFPVTIIRWHDGARVREIVVRGFDPYDQDKVKEFTKNIYMLLSFLKRVVYSK